MYSIALIIIKLTFLQGVIYSLIFIFNKKKNISFVLLGFFLFTTVGPHLGKILSEVDPSIRFFPANFFILSPAILFLYTKSVIGLLKNRDFYHLIPGIIDFFFSVSLFLFPDDLGVKFYDSKYPFVTIFFVYIIPAYYVIYAFKSIIIINENKLKIPMLYSIDELNRLNWIKITCYILIVANLFEAITSLMMISQSFTLYAYLFAVCMSAFVIYWITIYGLNQKNLFLSLISTEEKEEAFSPIDDTNLEKPLEQKKNYLDDDSRERFDLIVSFINTTNIYKNKDLNLFLLSDLIQMPYREVSRLINIHSNKNFNQFINEFRINEAKRLIALDSLNKFNLSGVALEVGFNSRSTFFTSFKSVTGMTPIEFKNKGDMNLK